jgi:hypothetical protein
MAENPRSTDWGKAAPAKQAKTAAAAKLGKKRGMNNPAKVIKNA